MNYTKQKPEHKLRPVKTIKTEIFPDEKSGRDEIENINTKMARRRKLKSDFELKAKKHRTNSIKIFPGKKEESSIKNLLTDPDKGLSYQNNHTKNKSLMNHTVYRQNINPENTYDRLFRVGDLQGEINQRKKIMYKSNKFKKARYDHLQDLMDHQLKFRDKDDNITLKPNQVSYSVMVTENNENYKKRLFSDYQ